MSGSCGWFPLGRDEIQAWIERHRDDLPQTLDEVARYPIPFRKAIVFAVSPETRVSLWGEHLSTFLAPGSELSAEQQAAIRESIALLPEIFGSERGTDDARARARVIQKRIRPLFSPEQGFRIFASLGPPEPPEGLPIPADALPPTAP